MNRFAATDDFTEDEIVIIEPWRGGYELRFLTLSGEWDSTVLSRRELIELKNFVDFQLEPYENV